MKKALLAVFASVAVIVTANAQVLVYNFGTSVSPNTGATTIDANIGASSFASFAGSGATGNSIQSTTAGGSGGAYFVASNWKSTDNNYFYVTITPEAGYQVSISGLSYYYGTTTTGPTTWSLVSSKDSYVSTIASGSLTSAVTTTFKTTDWHQATSSVTLTFTSATTLRLAATGASSAAGTFRLDDFTLTGTVSAVPEPSTYAAIFGGLALLGAVVHRHRSRRAAAPAPIA